MPVNDSMLSQLANMIDDLITPLSMPFPTPVANEPELKSPSQLQI